MSDLEQKELHNGQPIPVPIEGLKTILNQMENSICKISHENGKKDTGFFCNIPLFDKSLPFLITNNHVLNENDIKNNYIIKITINDKIKKIKIDDTRKKYTNKDLDITFIEIRPHSLRNVGVKKSKKGIITNKNEKEFKIKKTSIFNLHKKMKEIKVELKKTTKLIKEMKKEQKKIHRSNRKNKYKSRDNK